MKNRHIAIALLATVAITGLILRIWMAFGQAGTLDSDMAVLGLMARNVQDGHFTAFHWGQYYGGAQEAYIAAVIGLIGGVKAHTLYITTILLSAGVAVMTGLVAKELHGARAGWIAGGLFWLWPAPFVWWSVKIGSNYWYAPLIALTAGLLLLKLRRAGAKLTSTLRVVIIGVLIGQAWWANPQSLYILVPFLIYALRPLSKLGVRLSYMAVAAVASSLPWWWTFFATGGKPLEAPGATVDSIWQGPVTTLRYTLPMVLGFRVPFSGEWVGGAAFGIASSVLVATLILVGLWLARPRPVFAAVSFVGCLAVFLSRQWALYGVQPRYLLWFMPWLVILIAAILVNVRKPRLNTRAFLAATAALAAGITALTSVHLAMLNHTDKTLQPGPDVFVPTDLGDMYALLRENNVKYFFADYWLSYRATFETDGELIATPQYTPRWGPYEAAVGRSGNPPHVMLRDSGAVDMFERYCQTKQLTCETKTKGAFLLLQPSEPVGYRELDDFFEIKPLQRKQDKPYFT